MKIFKTFLCTAASIAICVSCSHKIYDNIQTYGSNVDVIGMQTDVQHDTLTMQAFRAEVSNGTLPPLDIWASSSYVELESRRAYVTYGYFSSKDNKIYTAKQVPVSKADTLMILQIRSIATK